MFPQFPSKVRFWQVEDLAFENPQKATNRILEEIHRLVEELSRFTSSVVLIKSDHAAWAEEP
jgi:hypothetical protein